MPDTALLIFTTIFAALAVGTAVGASGIGGFFIIPVLIYLTHLPLRAAIGTALVTSAANGALGLWLYLRRGNVSWSTAIPLTLGSVVAAAISGWLGQWLPLNFIVCALGLTLLLGSGFVLFRKKGPSSPCSSIKPVKRSALLAVIGSFSGLVAGVTGAGGPLVAVPLMTLYSFPVLSTIGSAQALQFLAGMAGAAPYWFNGHIELMPLALTIPPQLVGIWVGVQIAHKVERKLLAGFIALLGLGAGCLILSLGIFKML